MNVESPRVIFVGGSNVRMGLNCQIIRDSLNLNPINAAMHAAFESYMMNNTLQYVSNGDIVVLAFNYATFLGDYDRVSRELLSVVADGNSSKVRLLSTKQKIKILQHIPNFSLSKFRPTAYFNVKNALSNQYGDTYEHWTLKKKKFRSNGINGKFNPEVIQGIKKFQSDLAAKGATLLVTYPSYQDRSFFNTQVAVKEIEAQYIKTGFTVLGTPERYVFPDSLMYDSPYHLGGKGVELRTQLLIEDLRNYLKNNQ